MTPPPSLRAPSLVLIYTDGVVEARNRDDEELGIQRLIDICRAANDADALFQDIFEALDGWRGDTEQDDDITIVAVSVADP